MGAPYHEVRHLLAQHNVRIFSSNYALYANFSDRVMRILQCSLPQIEVYSIDEAFALLAPQDDPLTLCRQAQRRILQYTGLPTGVGIGPTKTLAKLANYAAKRWAHRTKGAVYLQHKSQWQALKRVTPVNEVWGIGTRLSAHLDHLQIHTAADLANANTEFIRRRFSVTVQQTVLELRGIACFGLHTQPEPRQEIRTSRLFGQAQSSLSALKEALATYGEQACSRMRAQHSVCAFIRVRLTPQQADHTRAQHTCALPYATDHTNTILKAALEALRHIWKPGQRYKKVSIYLGGLQPKEQANLDLFSAAQQRHQDPLTHTLDQINQRWGQGTIHSAQANYRAPWSMRQQHLSPRYTTRADEAWTVFCR